jgi:hypothetical protein
MKIVLLGNGSSSFLAALDGAGIEYTRSNPSLRPGSIQNSAGEAIDIVAKTAATGVPVAIEASIASVIKSWIRAQAARKFVITSKDGIVCQAEGYSIAEIEQLLITGKSFMATDPVKPDSKP